MRPTPLSLLALLLLACSGGSADDATDDPTDSAEDTNNNTNTPDGETLPCNDDAYDLYSIDTPPTGGVVVARIDTVSAATTFDPYAELIDTPTPTEWFSPTALSTGDDEFDCTFPPPTYGCPEVSYTSTGGTVYLLAGAYSSDCNSSGIGTYDLTVTLDGNPVTPTLVTDDGVFTTTDSGL